MSDMATQVIAAIAANRERFAEFCLSLSDEEQRRPVPDSTWIVKDFAAHLATLDGVLLRYFEAVRRGGKIDMTRSADGAEAFDLDAWNDAEVEIRRGWSMQRVFEEAAVNRAELIALLGRLRDDELDRPMHFSDPKRGSADFPLKLFLTGWSQHDPIHVADMLKALPERASEPALRAWLDNPFVSGYQASMSGTPKR
jgi:hypothetical protein